MRWFREEKRVPEAGAKQMMEALPAANAGGPGMCAIGPAEIVVA
jgi:hypothetical protein